MTFNEIMTAIADKIRDILVFEDKIRLTEIPTQINNVWDHGYWNGEEEGYWTGYDEGYADGSAQSGGGYDEGYSTGFEDGKQDECDRFWDEFQDYGKRTYYTYAFYHKYGWTDKNFKPKYPFTIGSGNQMFSQSALTSTVQPVDITNATSNYTSLFSYSSIVTIPKFITAENKSYTSDFTGCTELKNITFEGVIGKDINFQSCPLTIESMLSVLTHLANFLDTDKEGVYTLTFSAACWQAIQAWASDDYDRAEVYLPGYASHADIQDWVMYDLGWSVA